MKFIILRGNGDVDTLMSKEILRSPARPLKKPARAQTFQIVETRDNICTMQNIIKLIKDLNLKCQTI